MKTQDSSTAPDRASATTARLSLGVLGKLSPQYRAYALAEALLQATPQERLTIAPWLLELATPRSSRSLRERLQARLAALVKPKSKSLGEGAPASALAALASCFASLPGQAQEVALVLGSGRWKRVVSADIEADARPRVRASLAMLAGRSGERETLPWIRAALADGAVRSAGEQALCMFALAGVPRAQREVLGAGVFDAEMLAELAPRLAEGSAAQREQLQRDVLAVIALGETQGPASLTMCHAALLAMTGAQARRFARGRAAEKKGDDADDASRSEETLALVLQRGVRMSDAPLARVRALALCHVPALARACATRLARCRNDNEHELLLSMWHLALRPARRGVLASVPVRVSAAHGPRKTMGFGKELALPSPKQTRTLSEQARVGLTVMCRAMHVQAKAREALLEPLLVDPSVRVRQALVRNAPEPLLRELVWDSDAVIAHSAVLRVLDGADAPPERSDMRALLTPLLASQHARVRAMAACQQPTRSQSERRDARAGMLSREQLLQSVRAQLVLPAAKEDVHAATQRLLLGLARARARSLVREVESDVLLLTLPGKSGVVDDRVRATAVMTLAWSGTSLAFGAIASRLSDGHERVRANAVEAAAQWSRRFGELFGGLIGERGAMQPVMKPVQPIAQGISQPLMMQLQAIARERAGNQTHHRERANAALLAVVAGEASAAPQASAGVQALHESVEVKPSASDAGLQGLAIETTLSMLRDDRPMQRVAGLWLAWRLASQRRSAVLVEAKRNSASTLVDERLALLRASIEEVAEIDAAASVRDRAASLAKWLQDGEESGDRTPTRAEVLA